MNWPPRCDTSINTFFLVRSFSLSLSFPSLSHLSTSLIDLIPHSRCLNYAHRSGNPLCEAYRSGRSTRRKLLDTIYELLVPCAHSSSPFHFGKAIDRIFHCTWSHWLWYGKSQLMRPTSLTLKFRQPSLHGGYVLVGSTRKLAPFPSASQSCIIAGRSRP